jgi:hypothetical protein
MIRWFFVDRNFSLFGLITVSLGASFVVDGQWMAGLLIWVGGGFVQNVFFTMGEE